MVRCFGNFERALPENRLWELSERLKPRANAAGAANNNHLLSAPSTAAQQNLLDHPGGGHNT